MSVRYSAEENVQILIALMKEHGIRKIVVSPGTTNVCFVASVQQDPYFELYSSVDERSAAYMACGMAVESGEPIALSCTGATASRNYIPALTEAYYRKIPILAITSTRTLGQIGQNIDQVIDRTVVANDIAKTSVHVTIPHNNQELWECNLKINTALLELSRQGGGPVHINLVTEYNADFSISKLPSARVIRRVTCGDSFPNLVGKKVGVFVGAHKKWDEKITELVEKFCEKYDAIVLCDQTSNYKGKYAVYYNIFSYQKNYCPLFLKLDIMIHLGDVSASSYTNVDEVWRVHPDGEVRDTFRKLKYVFEMKESVFFSIYNDISVNNVKVMRNYSEWNQQYNSLIEKLKQNSDAIPFSNLWVAMNIYDRMPVNSVIHLGILNSLRVWNFFKVHNSINVYANTGGFGIDGCMSSLIGAGTINRDINYFGILGDLAFFYDMNALGNRHVGSNIRIMVINNGIGSEFKNNINFAIRSGLGGSINSFIAAEGHYGEKSEILIKNYVEALGFEYKCASSKEDFNSNIGSFIDSRLRDRPILFEIFTESIDETNALEILQNIDVSVSIKDGAKNIAKNILGGKRYQSLKQMIEKRM